MTERTDLFPPTPAEMARDALARLMEWIHRSAGQHQRYIRDGFADARARLLGAP